MTFLETLCSLCAAVNGRRESSLGSGLSPSFPLFPSLQDKHVQCTRRMQLARSSLSREETVLSSGISAPYPQLIPAHLPASSVSDSPCSTLASSDLVMSHRAGNRAHCRKEAGGRPQPTDILKEAREPRFICLILGPIQFRN